MRLKSTSLLITLLTLAATMPVAGQGFGLDFPGINRPAEAELFGDSRDKVKVTVKAAYDKVPQGGDLPIAVIFDHNKGWHIYANNAVLDPVYFRTVIEAESTNVSPLKIHSGFIQWPEKHTIDFFGDKFEVYQGKAIAYIPVTIPSDAPLGKYEIIVRPGFQTCDDSVCLQPTPYPPRAVDKLSDEDKQLSLSEWNKYGIRITIEVVDPNQLLTRAGPDTEIFGDFKTIIFSRIRSGEKPPEIIKFGAFGLDFTVNAAGWGFLLFLLVAAIGGFLLNLTPCVLPVIPLKIMGLSSAAGNRSRTLKLGTTMSFGVLSLWLAIGLALAMITGFTATNQLFQLPWFNIALGLFIALMAIGMCGLFSINLPRFVYGINPSHETYHGSFVFGIMTGILALPCIGPFMGAAAAAAATFEPWQTIAVFAAIGIGMALPYQVLSAFPHLVDKMPRTGPASELIKQIMGILLLAAGAYFIGTGISGWIVSPPDPPTRLYLWVVALVGVAAGGWMFHRTFIITSSSTRRTIFGGLGALIMLISAAGGWHFTKKSPIDWVYYTPQRFEQAKSEGNVVVMEFTAEWCLNCKALEATVLHREKLVELLNGPGIVPIKVDLTGNNTMGNQMLKNVQRVGIPLLVVFRTDGEEVFKGDFYTVKQVVESINEANGNQVASR